ncbi:MAG: hypothetical protein O7G85_03345 [Planctomycetota bacterium]|nr:hypothetical protein [Planctomycetota bacterium]
MSRMRPNEMRALQQMGKIGETGPASQVIDTDRKCLHCGYQLKGLPLGGNCPECGATTRLPDKIDSPLSLMPLPAILRLKWGCWAVFWCLILAMVIGALRGSGRFPEVMILTGLLAISLSWQVAVRLATPTLDLPQARLWGFHRLGKLRLVAQWLQVGWPIAAGAALLSEAIPNPVPPMNLLPFVLQFGLVLGITGLVILALVFERLAQWTRELEAMNLFNWIVWGLPAAVLVIPLRDYMNWWVSIVLSLFAIAMLLLYPFVMLMLARGVSLSVHHNIEYEERIERQDERKEEFFEKVLEPHMKSVPDEPRPAESEEIQLHDPKKDRSEET